MAAPCFAPLAPAGPRDAMTSSAPHELLSSPSDVELLALARDGDRAALERLIDRYQARVYRFSLKLCRDPGDAEDVLQETLLALARGVRDFRGASSLSTWLYAVTRSYCIKKRRRSKFAPQEVPLDVSEGSAAAHLPSPERPPDDALAGKQLERALETAIGGLEPMYREVLLLRDVEGLTAPEVAEILEVTPQAVKSRLHRARVAVRGALEPLLGLPAPAPAAATCPDVLTLYSQHLEAEISAELCAEMERHLEGCDRCRGACDSLRRTLALCRTSGAEVEVPAAVQQAVKRALGHYLGEGRPSPATS